MRFPDELHFTLMLTKASKNVNILFSFSPFGPSPPPPLPLLLLARRLICFQVLKSNPIQRSGNARREDGEIISRPLRSKAKNGRLRNEMLYFREITLPEMPARLNLPDEFLDAQAAAELHCIA